MFCIAFLFAYLIEGKVENPSRAEGGGWTNSSKLDTLSADSSKGRTRRMRRKSLKDELSISFLMEDLAKIMEGPRHYRVKIIDITRPDFPEDEEGRRAWLKGSKLGRTLSMLEIEEQTQLKVCERTRLFADELLKMETRLKKFKKKGDNQIIYDVAETTQEGEYLRQKYSVDLDRMMGKKKSRTFQALAAIEDFHWGRTYTDGDTLSKLIFRKSNQGGKITVMRFTSPQTGSEVTKSEWHRWKHYVEEHWKLY